MSFKELTPLELGKKGEDMVADYLRTKGYIIVKQNWHDSRFGEIDIIAENDKNVAFVEVRTRKENSLVSGLESVDSSKITRVKNAAESFMKRFNSDLPLRVDVAEVSYYTDEEKYHWNLHYIYGV